MINDDDKSQLMRMMDEMALEQYKLFRDFTFTFEKVFHNYCCHSKSAKSRNVSLSSMINFVKDETQKLVKGCCLQCYEYRDTTSIINLCEPIHPIVWAKGEEMDYWPAKCLRWNEHIVLVLFFGEYTVDEARIEECFKYSMTGPKELSSDDIMEQAIAEANSYIEKINQKCPEYTVLQNPEGIDSVWLDEQQHILTRFEEGPNAKRRKLAKENQPRSLDFTANQNTDEGDDEIFFSPDYSPVSKNDLIDLQSQSNDSSPSAKSNTSPSETAISPNKSNYHQSPKPTENLPHTTCINSRSQTHEITSSLRFGIKSNLEKAMEHISVGLKNHELMTADSVELQNQLDEMTQERDKLKEKVFNHEKEIRRMVEITQEITQERDKLKDTLTAREREMEALKNKVRDMSSIMSSILN